MVDLEIFSFDGAPVRLALRDGEPWWVHNDVCRSLGIADAPQAAERLDEDEKGWVDLPTPGGSQRIRVVNEPGLYTLVLRSKSPDAKRFKRWLTHEVLPSIRRKGSFHVGGSGQGESFPVPQTLPEALRLYADQIEATEAAKAEAAAAQKRLALAEPRAVAWTVLASAGADYDVGTAAAFLNRDPAISTGRNRLFGWMLAHGMTYKASDGRGRDIHKPYQKHVDAGRLVLRLGGTFVNSKTHEVEAGGPQLRITAKGVAYIHREMGGTAALDLTTERSEAPALPAGVQ